jgi:xyloglucan fucosyltransferase
MEEKGDGRASDMHQPSHEGRQKRGNKPRWEGVGEMYLLITCNVLVTTGFSTFGYVA